MYTDEYFDVEKIVEFFPQMERIMNFGTYVHDIVKDEIRMSIGLTNILGLPPNFNPIPLKEYYKFIHEDDLERVLFELYESIKLKKTYKVEFSIIDAQGNFKRVWVENYLKFDDVSNTSSYNGLVKDITEKFIYENTIQAKINQLDKSNNNLQEFAYVASHDLQEPLRKIATFSERLQTKYGNSLDEEGNLYINKISSSCGNMQILLEDLLDFSRLSFEEKKFEKASVDDILRDVLNDLEMKIQESGEVIIKNDLPVIEVYPSQIRQLFTNLIQNSIKFKKNDVPSVIQINCTIAKHSDFPQFLLNTERQYVKIVVEDNGIGFEPEFSEKIFMIFQRLHSKKEYGGSGIGLSICKKIVDNHSGFIFAESNLNQGAKFTILLPQNQS